MKALTKLKAARPNYSAALVALAALHGPVKVLSREETILPLREGYEIVPKETQP